MGLFDFIPAVKRSKLTNEQLQLQNESAREQLKSRKRREDAMGQLSGLLAPSNAPAGNMVEATPDMQRQRMMGLLGQVAPIEVAMSLLAPPKEERAETSLVRNLRAAGVDPQSEQGREIILQSLQGGNIDDLLKRLQATKIIQDLEQTSEEKRRNQQSLADSFRNGVSSARSILDANSKLEGTFLETGRTFPEYRAAITSAGADLIEFFGGDPTKARQQLTEFNTFKKQAANFAIDMIDRLEGATNQKFDVLRSSIANIGVDPQTNRRIIGEVLKRTLQEADRYELNIPDNERADAFKLLKEIERGDRDFGFKTTIPGFNELTQAEQDELKSMLDQLTPQQRSALFGR